MSGRKDSPGANSLHAVAQQRERHRSGHDDGLPWVSPLTNRLRQWNRRELAQFEPTRSEELALTSWSPASRKAAPA